VDPGRDVEPGCGGASTAPSNAGTSPPTLSPVPNASRLASDYTNEIVATMQTNSINRNRIDWTDFRGQLFQAAQGAQTIPADRSSRTSR
jgi:hypothetical protein